MQKIRKQHLKSFMLKNIQSLLTYCFYINPKFMIKKKPLLQNIKSSQIYSIGFASSTNHIKAPLKPNKLFPKLLFW